MKQKLKIMSLFALLTLSLFSCKKEEEKPNVRIKEFAFGISQFQFSPNKYWFSVFNFPEGKDHIKNGGVVLVYYYYNGTYKQMPFTEPVITNVNRNYSYLINDDGQMGIIIMDDDKSERAIPDLISVRIFLLSNVDKKSLENVDIKNYSEVKEALNLTD